MEEMDAKAKAHNKCLDDLLSNLNIQTGGQVELVADLLYALEDNPDVTSAANQIADILGMDMMQIWDQINLPLEEWVEELKKLQVPAGVE